MQQPAEDSNAAIWKSDDVVRNWAAETDERERTRRAQRDFMAAMLPFADDEEFTFLDLGAGTGAASAPILDRYPRCHAILADFSPQMRAEGERQMATFAGRFRYVEFDLTLGDWSVLPDSVDAVVTSLSVHHLPDERKRALFGEIYQHLGPGGWYLNYDPVTAPNPAVESAWQRIDDRLDPAAAAKRHHRSPEEQARYENHVRYMIPLDRLLGYLREAGFDSVDAYYTQLENVICGARRPG